MIDSLGYNDLWDLALKLEKYSEYAAKRAEVLGVEQVENQDQTEDGPVLMGVSYGGPPD